jgi:hypothetical protein
LYKVEVACGSCVIADAESCPEDLIERIEPAAVGIAIRLEIGGAVLKNCAGLVEIRAI